MCACICNLWVPESRENEEGTIKSAFILLTDVLHIYPPWYRFVLFPHVALRRRLICISLLFSGRCENQVQKLLQSRLNKGGKSPESHDCLALASYLCSGITRIQQMLTWLMSAHLGWTPVLYGEINFGSSLCPSCPGGVRISKRQARAPRLNWSNKVTKFQFDFFLKPQKQIMFDRAGKPAGHHWAADQNTGSSSQMKKAQKRHKRMQQSDAMKALRDWWDPDRQRVQVAKILEHKHEIVAFHLRPINVSGLIWTFCFHDVGSALVRSPGSQNREVRSICHILMHEKSQNAHSP